jgi:hypothetical protein
MASGVCREKRRAFNDLPALPIKTADWTLLFDL